MENPWKTIPLGDYEGHMRLSSVRQLQTLNTLMRGQLARFPVESVMILGVAGGNGLEHADKEKYRKIYGVDVNADYLAEARRRFPELDGVLECVCLDLRTEADRLPRAELVIADLLVEYIGCETFRNVIRHVTPRYVSCVIQKNESAAWVSDSPYLHAFDGLESVHTEIDAQTLTDSLHEIGFRLIDTQTVPLPNGKALQRLDFTAGAG